MNLWAHRVYAVPKGLTTFITLSLTTAITILLECMSYVHSTTLRWALAREGRLHKNSNLRLFSSAKEHFPNKWYMNVISFMSSGIIYGALSSLKLSTEVRQYCGDAAATHPSTPEFDDDALEFSAWVLLGIGAGLLLQAFVCTACLCNSSMVVTWSSHPLINAKAYFYSRLDSVKPEDSNHKSLWSLSLGEALSSDTASGTPPVESAGVSPSENIPSSANFLTAPTSTPDMSPEIPVSCPQERQNPMLVAYPEICRIRYIVWAYFGAFVIWSGLLGIVSLAGGSEADDGLNSWQGSDIVYASYPGPSLFTYRQDWVGLFVQILAQSSIVFGIHCIEIIVNLSRDESSWRKAASVGAEMGDSPVKSFISSWQGVILTLFKSVVQWVFDEAFSADTAVSMSLYPLVTMAALFLLLAIFTEYLVRRKPHGPQPVTYGDIQRLAHFIDDWEHKRLFWGDKGEIKDGIRRAGTAGCRLSELSPDAKYIGLT
ncbi:hypothetical protein N7528_008027 [Penicillium herquei]|nr:hypothetical protein N7528_008027 [Penicillium herquei]